MKFDGSSMPKKIGLVLGSGSARGWAHIGVISALAELGIRVEYVAGTSMGALVGAVHASGGIDALKEFALQLDWRRIVYFLDVVFPKSGLIDGKTVADFIRSQVKETRIEDLPLPFRAVSTDLTTGREMVIREGDIIEAVRASISIPGIFTPVQAADAVLVDGGLVNPVPVSVARSMGADFVIAVDLSRGKLGERRPRETTTLPSGGIVAGAAVGSVIAEKLLRAFNQRVGAFDFRGLTQARQWLEKDPAPNIFEVLIASINIMETQIAAIKLQADPPDILIRPNLGHIKFLEFNRAREAIQEGYRETLKQIGPLTG